jgi:hypothetical protein
MLAMLRNIGVRGAAYDRVVMRQYQQAFNAALPAYRASPTGPFSGLMGAIPLTADGIWGIQTAKTVFATLRVAFPSLQQPPDLPGLIPGWWTRSGSAVTQGLGNLAASMSAQIQAQTNPSIIAQSATGTEAVATARDTGSSVSTTTARVVDSAQQPGQASPPPGTAPGASAPIAPTGSRGGAPLPTEFRVTGNRPAPLWIFWGLGILTFAGVVTWAAWRKHKRRKASTGNRA